MSGPKKYLRTEGGERIDQPDFEHAAEESQLTGVSQIGETFIVGPDARGEFSASLKSFVLSGLQVTCPSANTIMVGAGTAILSWLDQGNLEHGVIIDVGTSESVVLSASISGPDTFGVFVRFNLQEAQSENRNFWNALAVTPVEITRQMATRRVDDMEISFAAVPATPGTEWTKLAEIIPDDLSPSTLAGITDLRDLFFEGVADNPDNPFLPPYRVTDNQWGSVVDRNADRAVYGLKGLRQFVRATQRQLQDIIGGGGLTNWWDNTGSIPQPSITGDGPDAGMSLKYVKDEAFSRYGAGAQKLAKALSGPFHVVVSNAFDIGETGTPWANVFTGAVELGAARLSAAAEALIPRIIGNMFDGAERMLLLESTPGSDTEKTIRMYLGPDSMGIEITHNAEWDSGTGLWGRDVTTTAASSAVRFSPSGGLKYLTRAIAEPANTWNDTSSATNWETTFNVGSSGVTQTYGTTTVNASLHVDDELVVVDGGVTLAGSAKYVLAPYLKSNTALLAAAAAVHNQPSVGGGASILVSGDPALNNSNIPKAWGRINIGSPTPGACSIYAGCGITTANTTGGTAGRLYIELADSFATSSIYTVVGITTNSSAGYISMWVPISTTEFEIGIYESLGVVATQIDLTSTTITISFQVMGIL